MSELIDPVARPRVHWWHLVAPIAASFAALVAFMMAMQVAPVLKEWFTRAAIYGGTREEKFLFGQVLLAVIYGVFIVVLRLMLGRPGRRSMVADFTRTRPSFIGWGLVAGVVLGLGSMALLAWISSSGLVNFKDNPAMDELMPQSAVQFAMAFATVVVIGPLAEELYFRGALLSWLRDKMGIGLAVALSAVLFGLAHLEFVMTPGAQGWITTGVITTVGLVNGWWAARTGSLWPAFATHAGFNGVMLAAAMFMPGI